MRFARSSFNIGIWLTVPLVAAEWATNGYSALNFEAWLTLFALGAWVGLAILVARASLAQGNRVSLVLLVATIATAVMAALVAQHGWIDVLTFFVVGAATLINGVLGSIAVVQWVLQGRRAAD